jgi:hypothetical protein
VQGSGSISPTLLCLLRRHAHGLEHRLEARELAGEEFRVLGRRALVGGDGSVSWRPLLR